jgi:glucose-6-phosphate 1-dehydrogenase
VIRRMLILGATGDLTPRYLLPALARLCEASKLPEGFRISGLARKEWDTEAFRSFAEESLAEHAAEVSAEAPHALVEVLEYHQADVTDPGRVKAALGDSPGPGGDSGGKGRLGSARHHDGSEARTSV